jgi:hypothetical protein
VLVLAKQPLSPIESEKRRIAPAPRLADPQSPITSSNSIVFIDPFEGVIEDEFSKHGENIETRRALAFPAIPG